MNDRPGRNFGLVLLWIAAAPLLLAAMALAVLTSRIANAIFGHDPAALLVKRHPEAWAILNPTGRCTLGLIADGVLLRGTV